MDEPFGLAGKGGSGLIGAVIDISRIQVDRLACLLKL
jgi:hypothetical protein